MTWEQKLAAFQALTEHSLRMRAPGDWYVEGSVEVKEGCILAGTYGNGRTPEAAVEDHWRQLVEELPREKYLVIRAYRDTRRAVRWNGYMWADVREQAPA